MTPDPWPQSVVAAFLFGPLTWLGLSTRRYGSSYPGFRRWVAATACLSLGMFLVSLRPSTAVWAISLFAAALVLAVEGNRAFCGQPARPWWIRILAILAVLGVAFAEHIFNPNLRIVIFSSFLAVAGGASGVALLRNRLPRAHLARRLTAWMFLLFAALYVVRAIYVTLSPPLPSNPPLADIFEPTVANGAFWIGGPAVFVACAYWWLIMTCERVVTDLGQQEAESRTLAETASAANRANVELLAVMSHEIRNPLSAALNLSDLMLQTELTEEQKEFETGVRTCVEVLMRVTEDIMDLSKIEAGELTIESRPFDVIRLVDGLVKVFRPAAAQKGVDLIVEIEDGSRPRNVIGDSGRLRQVITNFLGNAVKFTHRGHIRLIVNREVINATQIQLRIAVFDTGIGIPREMIPTVFERYGRAHKSTSTTYGGAGLGLRISKRLIEVMGGTMGVQSQPGKGSTFWFALVLPIAGHPGGAH